MRLQQIEARVIEIVELVKAGSEVEDNGVELKSAWPDPGARIARQLAGHANAARSEPILWIIGLDEARHEVVEFEGVEQANWWPEVRRWFDEESPDPAFMIVRLAEDEHVAAMYFDTSRAPYVVSVEGGGRVQLEVPWRSGNSTRSARRHELLSSVVEQAQLPELELVSGSIVLEEHWSASPSEQGQMRATNDFTLVAQLEILVSVSDEVTMPEHRQTWRVSCGPSTPIALNNRNVVGPSRVTGRSGSGGLKQESMGHIEILGRSGLAVRRSGVVQVHAGSPLSQERARVVSGRPDLDLLVELPVDRTFKSCRLAVRFTHVSGSQAPEPSNSYSQQRVLARFTPVL
ncbi:hypothetical protein IEZ26_18285 [Nocardioides cavernae]|uniref:ATP-binding protein n=1 Tax=Nocardioides cavernae TaxID=1921566 RepID=A0ABR8NEL6_9ACTN|nr:hypothetical protein [Nocardioides cavernae]MBD3926577.1 hypothetical protein [Nocardioides cavernae]MBM7512299.1 hypothetical protein [Nocardioides cavernae]